MGDPAAPARYGLLRDSGTGPVGIRPDHVPGCSRSINNLVAENTQPSWLCDVAGRVLHRQASVVAIERHRRSECMFFGPRPRSITRLPRLPTAAHWQGLEQSLVAGLVLRVHRVIPTILGAAGFITVQSLASCRVHHPPLPPAERDTVAGRADSNLLCSEFCARRAAFSTLIVKGSGILK